MAPKAIGSKSPTVRNKRSSCDASAFIPATDEPMPKVAALELKAELGLQGAALPAADQAMAPAGQTVVPRPVDVKRRSRTRKAISQVAVEHPRAKA